MTNEDTDVVVRFTRDEALVLFEWVHRAADEDALRSVTRDPPKSSRSTRAPACWNESSSSLPDPNTASSSRTHGSDCAAVRLSFAITPET
jgi:hypothetical protein